MDANRELLELLHQSNEKALRHIARIRRVFCCVPYVQTDSTHHRDTSISNRRYGLGVTKQDIYQHIDTALLGDKDFSALSDDSENRNKLKVIERALAWLMERGYVFRYKGSGIASDTLARISPKTWRQYHHDVERIDTAPVAKTFRAEQLKQARQRYDHSIQAELAQYVENNKSYKWAGDYRYFRVDASLFADSDPMDLQVTDASYGLLPTSYGQSSQIIDKPSLNFHLDNTLIEKVTLLKEAIALRNRVFFNYREKDKATQHPITTAKEVEPFGLINDRGNYLLVAYCRGEVFKFVLAKMSALEMKALPESRFFNQLTEEQIIAQLRASPEEYWLEQYGEQDIELLLFQKGAWKFYEKTLVDAKNYRFSWLDGAAQRTARVTFTRKISVALIEEILGLGGYVKVIGSPVFIDVLAENRKGPMEFNLSSYLPVTSA